MFGPEDNPFGAFLAETAVNAAENIQAQRMYQQEMLAQQQMMASGMKMPKYSRSQILYAIEGNLCQQYNYQIQFIIQRIIEFPPQLRHACAQGFISYLPQQIFTVTDRDGTRQIPFYFCSKCGKLFIPGSEMA